MAPTTRGNEEHAHDERDEAVLSKIFEGLCRECDLHVWRVYQLGTEAWHTESKHQTSRHVPCEALKERNACLPSEPHS